MAHQVKHPVVIYSLFHAHKIVARISPNQWCNLPEAETSFKSIANDGTPYNWALSLLPDRSVPFFVKRPGWFDLSGRFLPLNDYPRPIMYYDSHSTGGVADSFVLDDPKPRWVCTSSVGVIIGLQDLLNNNHNKTKVVLCHTDYSFLLFIGRNVKTSGRLCAFNQQTHMWRIMVDTLDADPPQDGNDVDGVNVPEQDANDIAGAGIV
ncbi:uncharacterized protein MELLADRAFT_95932 [Melampsora larici-populina 98AG31]|uniref:Uncharacterized protein n=1 Tax=Melampsora larici-populina (strain 98AG31 / pathotype 3-4-7) TaxID=747676 RepID=F4RDT0_MELLP|nr:uncharacterized protein MELLADRAFT_95932 [Melampsora larici-populina 98AG31]EGG09455.1 hypothetical protein MELLADRAFT_95932 [Melampsora larici-populina 98AG31]